MLLWEGNNIFFFVSLEEGRKGREGKGFIYSSSLATLLSTKYCGLEEGVPIICSTR